MQGTITKFSYPMKNLVWGKTKRLILVGFTKPEEDTTTKTTTIHKVVTQRPIVTHKEEIAALILFLTGGFTKSFMFR